MFNLTQKEEKSFLMRIIQKISKRLKTEMETINSYSSEIVESKSYLWQNIYELDPMEILSNEQAISQTINSANHSVEIKRKLEKLLYSPYFARIDFKYEGEVESEPIYIGIYGFTDDERVKLLIYDWRSPISSMFYDYEKGEASYEAPIGIIKGELTLKRQYKITNGNLEYMIESSVNINDDILQKELSKSSDSKMQNIVQTIQRDQNKIIRNTSSNVLIIQGAAGSGKTSIALHRVAYLLYKFKGTLSSKNILILSPNKIFSDYISTVLPELGEERILEVSMEEIAINELGKKIKFEGFYEQIAKLLDNVDKQYITRLKYKASTNILEDLDRYIKYITTEYFYPRKIKFGDYEVDSSFISSRYTNYTNYAVKARLEKVAEDVVDKVETERRCRLKKSAITLVKQIIFSMFKTLDLLELYKDFYYYTGNRELFSFIGKSKLEYADVFPLVYLKLHVFGHKDFSYVKHLVVDEMQDYCPVQYACLKKLFKCNKTILGDKFQSVNLLSSSNADSIKAILTEADILELHKSYRSTYEITNFAQKILTNDSLIAIERHGEAPSVIKYDNLIDTLVTIVDDFARSGYNSLGILCKTEKKARELYKLLDESGFNLQCKLADNMDVILLDKDSKQFKSGIIISAPYITKGLEFDEVIVIDADSKNYITEMDRSMLYIAVTRAMHKLKVLYKGNLTKFISE
jgi:DNA helicase-2/ATP-dependent DNA helicase PcrA